METKKVVTRDYKLVCRDGVRIITIPEEWKITYGHLHGGATDKYGREAGGGGSVLRVYETKAKQRAVFNDVQSFIDMSIPVKKLVVDREQNSSVKHEKGITKLADNAKHEEKWVEEK